MAAFAWQEEGPIDVGHVWQRTGCSVCEQFVGRFRLQVETGSESIVRCTLLDELNHRFLSEDFAVEETQFSNGSAIIANFAPEPRTVEGITIAARGFHIRQITIFERKEAPCAN
jgi:hypothetical protein